MSELEVLICTKNTPLALEVTVLSLLKNHPNFDFKLYVANNGSDTYTEKLLDIWQRQGVVCLNLSVPGVRQHGEMMSRLWNSVKGSYVLTLDSDINFIQNNVIDRYLIALQNDPTAYVASDYETDLIRSVFTDCPNKFLHENLNQFRPRPCVAVWRNDDLLNRVLERFSFGPVIQSGWTEGRFWDTCGLVASVLEIVGRKCVVMHPDGYVHFNGLTWRNNKYNSVLNILEERVVELRECIKVLM